MNAIVQGLLIIRKCFQTVCGLMIFRPLEISRVGTQATPQQVRASISFVFLLYWLILTPVYETVECNRAKKESTLYTLL